MVLELLQYYRLVIGKTGHLQKETKTSLWGWGGYTFGPSLACVFLEIFLPLASEMFPAFYNL